MKGLSFFLEALKGKVSYDFCSQYLRNGVTFQYSTYNRKKDSFSYFQTRAAQSTEHAYNMNAHLVWKFWQTRNTTKINDCYNDTVDIWNNILIEFLQKNSVLINKKSNGNPIKVQISWLVPI